MVAITVILAAVIGAFVLEIGDQQETAPSTSFDSEENTRTYDLKAGGGNGPKTWRRVQVAHAGGDVVDFTQMAVKVEGNDSVYNAVQTGGGVDIVPTLPQQNPYAPSESIECPPGESCEFTSGQQIAIMFYGVVSYETAYGPGYDDPDKVACWCNPDHTANLTSARFNYGSYGGATLPNVQQGDSTNIVWSAQSGGKTQTLFKYEVQGAR
jgi:FlaG/FlaF family flagellin (archaellin)